MVAMYAINFTPQEMQLVIAALAELPFKAVGNLVPNIVQQCENQETAVKEEDVAKFSKKAA